MQPGVSIRARVCLTSTGGLYGRAGITPGISKLRPFFMLEYRYTSKTNTLYDRKYMTSPAESVVRVLNTPAGKE